MTHYHRRRLPRVLILPLLCFLFLGALLGAGAGLTSNRPLQIAIVCVAAAVGVSAGLVIRASRKNT